MSDFETVKCLGKGGYGTVNLVRHKETSQNLAMKMIRRERVTESSKAEVYLERDILTFSDNPFVISMFCTFETEEHLCMVMENAGGGDCEGLLDRYERLPLDLAHLYVAQTVLALEYIHSYGILHGDLNPRNLLISSTGHIKLADFGVSKIGPVNMTVDPKDLKNNAKEFLDSDIFGTPQYMAPEIIQMEGYGKSVDWWALGIILHEFLSGTVPFDGDSVEEIFEEVVSKDINWSQNDVALPTDAQDIITRLLTKDCESRLGTGASEVKAHPFFQGLDWNNLDQEVPQLKNEENTAQSESDDRSSEESSASSEDEGHDEAPVEFPDFCCVAFRFKAYNCPEPLDSNNLLNEEVPQLESEENTAAAFKCDMMNTR